MGHGGTDGVGDLTLFAAWWLGTQAHPCPRACTCLDDLMDDFAEASGKISNLTIEINSFSRLCVYLWGFQLSR